jgi:hypothetical protein
VLIGEAVVLLGGEVRSLEHAADLRRFRAALHNIDSLHSWTSSPSTCIAPITEMQYGMALDILPERTVIPYGLNALCCRVGRVSPSCTPHPV